MTRFRAHHWIGVSHVTCKPQVVGEIQTNEGNPDSSIALFVRTSECKLNFRNTPVEEILE
jgi:hypothetical protein